jgi:hypothetical protein
MNQQETNHSDMMKQARKAVFIYMAFSLVGFALGIFLLLFTEKSTSGYISIAWGIFFILRSIVRIHRAKSLQHQNHHQ